MRRAAISLSKLADTARDELPSTMAAIRLSGMEISDLTLELSDLRYLYLLPIYFLISSEKPINYPKDVIFIRNGVYSFSS